MKVKKHVMGDVFSIGFNEFEQLGMYEITITISKPDGVFVGDVWPVKVVKPISKPKPKRVK